MAEDEATSSETGTTEERTPAGGRTATEFRDIADGLRNRVDLFGKTLAAIATLGTTAVGLSKIGDLFPAEGNEYWVWAACLGLASAAMAAIWVAVRLMRVARPVFMRVDLDGNEELDPSEREAVRPVSMRRLGGSVTSRCGGCRSVSGAYAAR